MLAVKFQSSNPNKHPLMPSQWPWLVVPVEQKDDSEGWVEMTESELNALKITLRPAYEQFEATIAQQELIKKQVEDKIKKALEFGQQLLIEFAAQNVIMGITQQGKTKEVADYLEAVVRYLSTGSLYEVINEINRLQSLEIPPHLAPFITNQRLEEFKGKILSFLQG